MTVLRRDEARGFETKRTKGFVVGLAMAVVGLAAAFGISQLIDTGAVEGSPVATLQTQAPAYAQPSQSPVATLGGEAPAYAQAVERGAAMTANVEALTRTGQAQQQAILDQALNQNNAVQARSAFEKATGAGVTTWTLEDELAAIHGRTGTEPTSSVGAIVSQPTPEQALAGIHGRTGYQGAVATTAQPTVEQQLAAIEARTGVQQGIATQELGWSAEELAEFHARNGFEPKTYTEQPSGPR